MATAMGWRRGAQGDDLGKTLKPHRPLWPMMGKLAVRIFGRKVSKKRCLRFEINLFKSLVWIIAIR